MGVAAWLGSGGSRSIGEGTDRDSQWVALEESGRKVQRKDSRKEEDRGVYVLHSMTAERTEVVGGGVSPVLSSRF